MMIYYPFDVRGDAGVRVLHRIVEECAWNLVTSLARTLLGRIGFATGRSSRIYNMMIPDPQHLFSAGAYMVYWRSNRTVGRGRAGCRFV